MPADKPKGRHFTEAARAAAMLSRQRKREMRHAIGDDRPEVFVVRQFGGTLSYEWEIRRFGGVVLARSEVAFLSKAEARSAGDRVLTDQQV